MNTDKLYIDGQWLSATSAQAIAVVNPATEVELCRIPVANAEDIDLAVTAAGRAFSDFSQLAVAGRIQLLENIIRIYGDRMDDMVDAISQDMGAPLTLARLAHGPGGLGHFQAALDALKDYAFEKPVGNSQIIYEPVGVCAMITPWNWPINQIACKVAPALACGCTMVLKASEVAPLSAILLAEILHEAGVPAGVFNLIHGNGPDTGAALVAHAGIDMVSFTGSTNAGIEVAKLAAPGVKRVSQELGGKSANILLPDCDFEQAVARDAQKVFMNSGQTCNAPTRMLVPRARLAEVEQLAKAKAESVIVGAPDNEETGMGPVVSATQWQRVQAYIQKGLDEGATLVTGGPGKPEGLETGCYVRPTVFSNVDNSMPIAQEEIFGPVLVIIPYDSVDEAIAIANDCEYGLSGYVSSADRDSALSVAKRLRTGMVHLNGAGVDRDAPFGGYKKSGNGREWGVVGFHEFLEIKAIMG